MSKEIKPFLNSIYKLLICVVYAILYSWGGSDFGPLAVRRFICPTLLSVGMFCFSKDWRVFIQLPFMGMALSIGYGADITWLKILKRTGFAAANGTATSIYNGIKQRWRLCAVHIALLLLVYVNFGVWNPLPDARTEELVLGFLVCFIPLMSVRRNEG